MRIQYIKTLKSDRWHVKNPKIPNETLCKLGYSGKVELIESYIEPEKLCVFCEIRLGKSDSHE